MGNSRGQDTDCFQFLGILQSLVHFFLIRNITKNQHYPDNLAFLIADRRAAVGKNDFRAVAADEGRMVGQIDNASALQDLVHRIFTPLAASVH